MALRAVAESKLGSASSSFILQKSGSKENAVRVRKIVLGSDKQKVLEDVLNTKQQNYHSNKSRKRQIKLRTPQISSPRILNQAVVN